MTRDLQLHKGEVLYFEIAGWVNAETPIMAPQGYGGSSEFDRALQKEYQGPARDGKGLFQMLYSYGCAQGERRMFVYRITRLNEDGVETELPWPLVMQRCKELGLQTVPQLAPPMLYNGDVAALRATVEALTDGASTLDPRHIREGVVVRVETPDGRTAYYKNKSFAFGLLEGYLKTDDTAVDREEAA
jgi:hypothetical protein